MAADAEAGLPRRRYAVPTDGTFSRPPGKTTGPSVDGPQWVLERWSQINHVFRFIRLEDMAYDKRPGMSNVVYVVDSGAAPPARRPRRRPLSTNGRIWKMVLDQKDPTKVTSLSVFIEGDDAAGQDTVRDPSARQHRVDEERPVHHRGPGSSQQFNFSRPAQRPAAAPRRGSGSTSSPRARPASRSRSTSPPTKGTTDVDTTGRGNLGAWEASGIIDVSTYVRARRVPRHRPGPFAVRRDGTRRRRHRRHGRRLPLQARRGPAPAGPHPGRLTDVPAPSHEAPPPAGPRHVPS